MRIGGGRIVCSRFIYAHQTCPDVHLRRHLLRFADNVLSRAAPGDRAVLTGRAEHATCAAGLPAAVKVFKTSYINQLSFKQAQKYGSRR